MNLPYDRAVLVHTLVYHYRTPSAGCGCGWHVLGASHPDHVADVYEQRTPAPRSRYRQFTPPPCPTCGAQEGRSCVKPRTGDQIQHPHPARAGALISALYGEVVYLQDLLDRQP